MCADRIDTHVEIESIPIFEKINTDVTVGSIAVLNLELS